MSTSVSVILRATGVFALIIIGAIIAAVGRFNKMEEVAEIGFMLMGIGVFIVVVFGILSAKQGKNYFTGE